jgi:beta-1,4-mannosyltransferase
MDTQANSPNAAFPPLLIYPEPYSTRQNPYCGLLYDHIQGLDADIEIVQSSSTRQLIRRLILEKPPSSTLRLAHFHWIGGYYSSRNFVTSVVKLARFAIALRAVKARNVKLVWTMHNALPHETRHPKIDILGRKLMLSLSDAVIVHCKAAQELIRSEHNNRANTVYVIPIGNYMGVYGNRRMKRDCRDELKIDQGDFVFLSLGRIHPYKGHDDLIKAFKSIDDPQAILIIAGKPSDPRYVNRLQELRGADGRIRIETRFVPDSAVSTYLGTADAAVLPFKRILTSASAILSMSYAVPPIVPDIGCIPELVEDGRTGFLFEAGDTSSLIDAMIRARNNGSLIAIGEAALDTVSRYGWDLIARQTSEVYRSL